MNVRIEPDSQVESIAEASSLWRDKTQASPHESTKSLRAVREFDRYMVAALSLMLMILVGVGAAGYASIRGSLGVPDQAATDSHLPDGSHEVGYDHRTIVAVAIGLMGALLLAVAIAPARIKIKGASTVSGQRSQLLSSSASEFRQDTGSASRHRTSPDSA